MVSGSNPVFRLHHAKGLLRWTAHLLVSPHPMTGPESEARGDLAGNGVVGVQWHHIKEEKVERYKRRLLSGGGGL